MFATLAFVQATFAAIRFHTVKALRLVKIEIIRRDFRLQAQKLFDSYHLGDRVFDQAVAIHDEDLVSREDFQPLKNVGVVDGNRNGPNQVKKQPSFILRNNYT